ncbi:MAG: SprB repeat-containing protein [Bacteroidales bacterium]|nr:SprB repeat-containing protein [Bacteroidales bacterium]
MTEFFGPKSGCNLYNILYMNVTEPTIFFPLLAEDAHALDYCYVRRYSERSDLNANPSEQLGYGQVSSLCVRNDFISLWDLLRKGYDTIYEPNENAYYVYRLEPGWKAAIQEAPGEYGSRHTVTLKADLSFLYPQGNGSESQGMIWCYSVGNGPRQVIKRLSENAQISFSLNDIDGARPGDNITVDAGASDDGKKHLKVIRFYPELPPVNIPTQIIEATDSVLRTLKVKLPLPLNEALQEEFTTLTCYKSISMRADGVFNISESEVLFQTDVSKLIKKNGTVEIPIPNGKFLKKGTYYLTLEGRVKGLSNRPDQNASFSAQALSAMFPCHTFQVVKNDLPLQNLTITPPKCSHQKGRISFSHSSALIAGFNQLYEVHEWINGEWQRSPLFSVNKSNSLSETVVTARADSVPQGEHRFAFRYYNEGQLKGHTEFDGSIPVVPPIEWPIQIQHISGTIIESERTRTTEDGFIFIPRNQIKNGKPPYNITYGTLNAQGQQSVSSRPFPQDTLHVSQAGWYHLSVSDADLCVDVRKIQITVLDNHLGVNIQENRPISCHGTDDGVLQAVPTGNIDAKLLDLCWKADGRTVGNEAQQGDIRGGTIYTVEVQHRLLPKLKTTASFSLAEPEPFSLALSSVTDVKCYGQHTGAATFLIDGGTPPLSGFWDNFTDGFKLKNVPAGRYKLKVFDARNCLAEYTANIRQPDAPLRIVIDSLQHVHYNAQGQMQLGYFDAHATGGTPPLSKVSCNTFSLPQKNKVGGNYPLHAGDANNCTVDTTITVMSYDRLSASINKSQEVSCFNGYDGVCMLWIRGGYPPYTVKWSNGSTERQLMNLPAGTYRATVTDFYGSRTTAEVIFNEPAPITAEAINVEPPSYAGYQDEALPDVAADGRLTAFIKGGTPPYHYEWTNLTTGKTVYTELPVLEHCESGQYRLDVSDDRMCSASFEITVPAVAPLQAGLTVTAGIACQGETTGELQASVTGGTPPYRYGWRALDGGAAAETALAKAGTNGVAGGLPAGRYGLTVTDALDVSATATLTLTEPEHLSLTVAEVQDASYGGCTDGVPPASAKDGAVRVFLSGGSGIKQLRWLDGSGSVLQESELESGLTELQALGGGTYRLLAEDAHGCRDTLRVTVSQPDALMCSIRQTDSIRCQGGREAVAQASVEGGVPPYRYRLGYGDIDTATTGVPSADAELVFPMLWKLRAGYYTFYVTDDNGVESSCHFYIPEPETLQGALHLTPPACHEFEDGRAVARIRGGTPPYVYRWFRDGFEQAEETAELDGLTEGRLEVRVQDRNGCTRTLNGTMVRPEPLTARASVSEETYAGSLYQQAVTPADNGAIQLSVQGGTPPYDYKWTYLTAGNDDGQALDEKTAKLNGQPHGIYRYGIVDAHGCFFEDTAEIVKTPDLRSEILLQRIIRCADSHDGALQALVQGGTPPYRYDWQWNGQPFLTPDGAIIDRLDAGHYWLTVTDAKGVVSLDSFYLSAPQPLGATVNPTAVSGYGAVDGHIDWAIEGGTAPHTAAWQGESDWMAETVRWDGALSDSLWSGVYHLTLTDANGCRFELDYTVGSPDSLSLSNLHILHCQGEKAFLEGDFRSEDNGRIRAYLDGGVPPYHIVWRNAAGGTVADFTATERGDVGIDSLPSDIYTLTVTDAHGYGLSRDFEVELSTAVQVLLSETTPIDCHGGNGVLTVLADGGKAPYTYRWFEIHPEAADSLRESALPHTSAVSPPLPGGYYRVEIEDAYGVTATDSLRLDEPAPLRLAADLRPWQSEQPDAPEAAGLLYPNPTGGCPPYRYDWAHGDTGDHIAYRRGENYAVTVYDQHRCAVRGEFPFNGLSDFEARISCTQAVSCHGEADGALSVEILGGQPPYRVVWQHGDTGVYIRNLPAALYELSVIDADNRTCAAAFNLTEPEPLANRILPTMPRCSGRADGSLSAEMTGGSYPYRYQWQDGPETAVYDGLAAGAYRLTVTDRNGCTLRDSVTLQEPAPLHPILTTLQPLCPDDYGQLKAEADGGTPPYHYQWYHADYTSATRLIQNAKLGYYLLTVTDSLLCRADTNVTLVRAAALQWQPFETQYLCAGQSTVLRPTFTDEAPDVVGHWTLPDGNLSSGLEAESDQDGLHILTLLQYDACLYQDTVRIVTVDDTVNCLFWISTQLRMGETATAADVSYPPADSSHWTLPPEAELLYAEGPYAEFFFHDTGTFDITLTSFRGHCAQSMTTQVQVLPEGGFKRVTTEAETPFLGLRAAPNPATGHTQIVLDMRWRTEVEYALIEAVSGRIRQRGKWSVDDGQTVQTLRLPEQAGLYVLMLHAENETKNLKLIVTKP